MYTLIRRFLFLFPAEFSHKLGLRGLKFMHRFGLSSLLVPPIKPNPVDILGLHFSNPIGLAAGLDKNADYIDALGALGFGFIEVGTVTPKAQTGNAKPRLFRLSEEQAIINRMGFNNKGVAHVVERLKHKRFKGIVGVNIGKNFSTPVEKASDDYLFCLKAVYPFADYIVVNLSSPNTPGLRKLQFGAELDRLLASLKTEQGHLSEQQGRYVPLLLKIAPDLSEKECQDIAMSLLYHNIDGVIACNTTISRRAVSNSVYAEEAGGLSGLPLAEMADNVISVLHKSLQGSIPIIGVGGISNKAGAEAKYKAGANLLQIYTGFIYQGPGLIAELASVSQGKTD